MTSYIIKNISKTRKIAELKIAAFIAEHTSVTSVDHLGALIKDLDSSSSALAELKLHRTKCTGLIKNVLSPCFLEDLVIDIGDSFYSLIIDESTSVDNYKLMCLIIRYFSSVKKKVITTFYRLIEIDGGDATTITEAVKKALKEDNLKLEKMLGLGVDGANVMVGEHHSVSSLLKVDLPELVVIKCVCHSLHLCAEHACRTLPRSLDFMVRECHKWFSCSTKRQVEYQKLHEVMTDKLPLKIDKLSGTRWLARANAISKIVDQWEVLKLHFHLVKDKERCYVADQLSQMLESKTNYLYLIFLRSILKRLASVNMAFQSDNVEPVKLLDDLNSLLYEYMAMIVPQTRLEKYKKHGLEDFSFLDYVMDARYMQFSYEFNIAASAISLPEQAVVKEKCREFLIELCKQIQKRIPSNISILEKCKYFDCSTATSQLKPDITQLAVHFRNVCIDIDSAVKEWNLLHREEWCCLDNSESFWGEVAKQTDALGNQKYGYICKLACAVLCLPFSNAAVERAFSLVNVVKCKLRNRIAVKTAEAILRVRYSLETGCHNFNPSEKMLSKFNSENVYGTLEDLEENVLNAFSGVT